ncbi:unnamed protein product, partial [marine sediment metagenome]
MYPVLSIGWFITVVDDTLTSGAIMAALSAG